MEFLDHRMGPQLIQLLKAETWQFSLPRSPNYLFPKATVLIQARIFSPLHCYNYFPYWSPASSLPLPLIHLPHCREAELSFMDYQGILSGAQMLKME